MLCFGCRHTVRSSFQTHSLSDCCRKRVNTRSPQVRTWQRTPSQYWQVKMTMQNLLHARCGVPIIDRRSSGCQVIPSAEDLRRAVSEMPHEFQGSSSLALLNIERRDIGRWRRPWSVGHASCSRLVPQRRALVALGK
jgi:hypothetical protein